MELYVAGIIILAALAVSDLIVGVSNDAVNFLNSSIGSKVAPRHVIMIIASLGMLAGVTFSKGMMEVARKGIFHPELFNMPELMIIFLAVMLTDVLLLDLYNTFGLPTSTTVSIVFELLGAAVAVSLIKINMAGEGFASLIKYINTAKAMAIIAGILLSVVVAFICGAVLQFLTRLLFTFDFAKRLKRYGAVWGGLALSTITFFILIKGAKGSTFITPETLDWIKQNTGLIFLASFIVFALILQAMMLLTKINILKPIVLVGTFALAMAFAANDLVNFIGVPLAGLNSFQVAQTTAHPLTTPMVALQKASPSNTLLLVLAGVIMAITLWVSRKARTVTATELNLGRQEEGVERFGSSAISRTVVRMFASLSLGMKKILPQVVLDTLDRRFGNSTTAAALESDDDAPSFDLLRAAVNLMVAGAVVSLATSMKLPLSTTYVTFMVAMGTSFADRAWGRDSAVYRVTGVFTVIGGWFLTALLAFTISAVFAFILFHTRAVGAIFILGAGGFFILRNHRLHKKRERDVQAVEIFNLKKIKDGKYAINTTFEHAGIFLDEVAKVISMSYEGLAAQDRGRLKEARKESKKIRVWANIIVANVFKTLRLLQKEDPVYTRKYAQGVNVLQELAECQRDAVRRVYDHVNNNHKPMLPVQLEELAKVRELVVDVLQKTGAALMDQDICNCKEIEDKKQILEELGAELDKNQVERIQDESSKTRLSILFYGFVRDSGLIVRQTLNLLNIFRDSFLMEKNEARDAGAL
ncbi:MAG: inorganic phosphate transporter [Candidatus Aminicenantes bacterium]|nr:inorganic phosphate transporter [Candidatus Aminicenantes bacterium]